MYEEYLEREKDDAAYFAERRKKRKRRNTIFLIGMIGLVLLIVLVIVTIYVLIPLWFEHQRSMSSCHPRPRLH